MALLAIKQGELWRGERRLLTQLNFLVDAGELVVVRGANGVGKSTLLSSLAGIELGTGTKGEWLVFGESGKISPLEFFNQGGYFVPQELPKLHGVKVGQLLRGMKFDLNAVQNGLDRIRLSSEFLELGIDELSGGQKKRLELMLSWLIKPKLLLWDEIDAGLDKEGLQLLCEIARELRTGGSGILFASHQEALVATLEPTRVIELVVGQ